LQLANYIKMNRKILLSIIFFAHFLLIIIYSIREAISLSLLHGSYITRAVSPKKLEVVDSDLSKILLHNKSSTKEDYVGFYMTLTGAQTPFNYFTAITGSVEKLIFEVEFKDGSRKIILPGFSSNEMAVRFKHLANIAETTPNELYRNLLIKRITEHEIRNYPDVKSVSAILGMIDIPSFSNYTKEHDLHFRCLYQYNYRIK
jgi:hypothetical protein